MLGLDLNETQAIESWAFNDDNGLVIGNGMTQPSNSSHPNQCNGNATRTGLPIELPPQEHLIDLAELFFEKLYHFLPILHKETILTNIVENKSCRLLLFAISAVAASFHPHREVQDSQDRWLREAKRLFCTAVHTMDHPLQTLQAANLIIYQSMLMTDYCTAWMVLGESWRKAVALGCSVIDSPTQQRTLLGLGSLPCRNWPDVEECRRSIWMLFILDRGMCFPVGLEHAIDDRRLCLNLPMADRDFQGLNQPEHHVPVLFNPDFSQLTTVMYSESLKKSTNTLQHLVVGYMLFGRISNLVFGPETDAESKAAELKRLASNLSTMSLMLPLSATRLSAADYDDYAYVAWLNVLMNVSSVFLYHRPSSEGEEAAIHWVNCIAAARNTVTMIRDATRISVELIINPHLASMFLACARELVIEYRCPSISQEQKNPVLLEDIKILYYASEKLNGALKALGKRFRNGLMFYLQQDEQQVLEGKAGGAKDLLKSCDRWPDFPDSEGVQFPA